MGSSLLRQRNVGLGGAELRKLWQVVLASWRVRAMVPQDLDTPGTAGQRESDWCAASAAEGGDGGRLLLAKRGPEWPPPPSLPPCLPSC